jgi:hypothetical protein
MTVRRAGTSIRAMRGPVAIVLAALLFGLAAQQLFFARAPGLNVLIATALFLLIGWWLRPRMVRPDIADAWLPVAALTFGVLATLRADAALVAFDALAAATLGLAWIAALGGARITRSDARSLAAQAANGLAGIVDRPVRLAAHAIGPISAVVRSRTGRLPRYAGGAALAVPFLTAFSVLFASADPIYAQRVGDLFDVVRWRDLFRDAGQRTVVFAVIAWLAAAALANLERARAPRAATEVRGVISAETTAVLLAFVDLLFAIFVAVQLGYLFGGRDTVDAAGIPYSAYARRGFFELMACTVIVGALLFGLGLQSRTRSRVTTALGLVLVALTLVVLVSAWYRLDLYQLAYGWTELRFYALAGIVFLGLALAVLGWCVGAARMHIGLQPIFAAALLVGVGVNALSPSAFVARADLERLIDPSGLPADAERRMDPAYLVSLGDGAFPVIIELLPSLRWEDRNLLTAWLRWTARGRVGTQRPWESFSIDHTRAQAELEGLR